MIIPCRQPGRSCHCPCGSRDPFQNPPAEEFYSHSSAVFASWPSSSLGSWQVLHCCFLGWLISCSAWDFWKGAGPDPKSILELMIVRLCFGWFCWEPSGISDGTWVTADTGLCLSVYEDICLSLTHHPWSWNSVLKRLSSWKGLFAPPPGPPMCSSWQIYPCCFQQIWHCQGKLAPELCSLCAPEPPIGLWQSKGWALSCLLRGTGLLGWVFLHLGCESCYNAGIVILGCLETGLECCQVTQQALSHTIPSCSGCQALHIAGIFLFNPFFWWLSFLYNLSCFTSHHPGSRSPCSLHFVLRFPAAPQISPWPKAHHLHSSGVLQAWITPAQILWAPAESPGQIYDQVN